MPSTVGRYRIDRVLGAGAFASVWLAHDEVLDSTVAVKVLSGGLIDDLDVRNRFSEEARLLRRADSERLVRVHDIGELEDGRPYFVMSYADRGTLAERMKNRTLPIEEAIRLGVDIAQGVEVINRLGIIHRDLKPTNILFQSTTDGGERLLIADLGLAKAVANASGAFTLPVGTPGYMSPEQARFGGGLDVRADVYGLGALAYHLLTGRAPGSAPVLVPPSALRSGLAPLVDEVVMRALEADRELRWPSAEVFAQALNGLLDAGEVDTVRDLPPSAEQTMLDRGDGPLHDSGAGSGATATHWDPGSGAPAARRPPDNDPGTTPTVREPGSGAHAAGSNNRPPPDDDLSATPTVREPGSGAPATRRPPDDDPGATPTVREPGSGAPVTRRPPDDDPGVTPTVRDHGGGAPAAGSNNRPPPDNDLHVIPTVPDPASVAPTPDPPSGAGEATERDPAGRAGPGGGSQAPPRDSTIRTPPPGGATLHIPPPQPSGETIRTPPPPVEPGGDDTTLVDFRFDPHEQRPHGPVREAAKERPGGRDRRRLLVAAGLILVLIVGGGGAYLVGRLMRSGPAKPKDGFVTVTDATGRLSVRVPPEWKRQQQNTWPIPVSDRSQAPALRATPNYEQFVQDSVPTPGLFAGLTKDLTVPLPPAGLGSHREKCTAGGAQQYRHGSLSGQITPWQCGQITISEVGLRDTGGRYALWVRIKLAGGPDITRKILDSITVRG